MDLEQEIERIASWVATNSPHGLQIGWHGIGFWTFFGAKQGAALEEGEFQLVHDSIKEALRAMAAFTRKQTLEEANAKLTALLSDRETVWTAGLRVARAAIDGLQKGEEQPL